MCAATRWPAVKRNETIPFSRKDGTLISPYRPRHSDGWRSHLPRDEPATDSLSSRHGFNRILRSRGANVKLHSGEQVGACVIPLGNKVNMGSLLHGMPPFNFSEWWISYGIKVRRFSLLYCLLIVPCSSSVSSSSSKHTLLSSPILPGCVYVSTQWRDLDYPKLIVFISTSSRLALHHLARRALKCRVHARTASASDRSWSKWVHTLWLCAGVPPPAVA